MNSQPTQCVFIEFLYSFSVIQNLTSSIFLWMSCSWSSHSCISESKLSISSGLSFPQPRPLCSSPRSRSMAAMTQAAQYPEAFFECQFPLSPVSLLCHCRVAGEGRKGSMAWNHYKDKHMVKKKKKSGLAYLFKVQNKSGFSFFSLFDVI